MRVAVCQWVAQQCPVFAHAYKVHTPSVNTDRGDGDVALCHEFQAFDYFKIKGIDVPIEVSARFYQVVVKTSQLFQFDTVVDQCADNGASAGGTQINGKKMLFVFHGFDLLAVLLRMFLETFGWFIIYVCAKIGFFVKNVP